MADEEIDRLHARIDALHEVARAAELLCAAVGERDPDGDFVPLPRASLGVDPDRLGIG